MKSSIFIPKVINVGFQNRNDTYTKKLAYIIYYDEKGKLRKETSWNSWRDNKIPNEEFENVPTSGFVLNKKVGDYDSGWNHRMAYCRIYDPRNFEFEITIENLLYILENTNSIKGKGLEGNFVYGWDGKDLVLIPTTSPDYIEIAKYNDIIHSNLTIKNKDLIVGATYIDKSNKEYIYMGKFDYYKREWSDYNRNTECYGWKYANKKKHHFFAVKGYSDKYYFEQTKNVNGRFISCINDAPHTSYAELFDTLEMDESYSPVDENAYEYVDWKFEDIKDSLKLTNEYNRQVRVISHNNEAYEISHVYNKDSKTYEPDLYTCKSKSGSWWDGVPDMFPYENQKNTYGHGYYKKQLPLTLDVIFEILKPKYRNCYLENGKFYKKETVW